MDKDFLIVDKIDTCRGIDTPEGRVGRLIHGEACSVQYLEMPPRLFMPEHTHPWESIVYTIRGHWVLCAGGNRSTMQPGSILWLRRGVSSAFEVPYPEPALILVFKPVREEPDDASFRSYREGVGRKADKRDDDRQKFDLGFLPPDHPAYVLE